MASSKTTTNAQSSAHLELIQKKQVSEKERITLSSKTLGVNIGLLMKAVRLKTFTLIEKAQTSWFTIHFKNLIKIILNGDHNAFRTLSFH